jgi:hypothetical protein
VIKLNKENRVLVAPQKRGNSDGVSFFVLVLSEQLGRFIKFSCVLHCSVLMRDEGAGVNAAALHLFG